jgi:biotin carboxylase
MMRLAAALDEFVVDGINTTIPLFKDLLANPDMATMPSSLQPRQGKNPDLPARGG